MVLWTVQIILAVSLAYMLIACLLTLRFIETKRSDILNGTDHYPPVTVFKPVKGYDRSLERALRSICEQKYPVYQLIFGVESENDPAFPLLTQLGKEYPALDLFVMTGSTIQEGTNGKIRQLCQMQSFAKYDIYVISDSDMLFTPDYLQSVVAPFAKPTTGVVTCLYRSIEGKGFAAALEAFCINLNFFPSVLVARSLGEISFAFGATMAVRKAVLEQIGGLAGLKNYLADDYLLGNRAYRAGHQVVLSDYVVDSLNHIQKFSDYFIHQLRWARTYRICRPVGYFFSIITHTFSLSLLFACLCLPFMLSLIWLAVVLVARLSTTAWLMYYRLHSPEYGKYLWALPIGDLLNTIIWALAFCGNTVVWGQKRFYVRRDGLMVPVAENTK